MQRWVNAEVLLQGEQLLVVELAALLHDVQGWKYADKDSSGFLAEVTRLFATSALLVL